MHTINLLYIGHRQSSMEMIHHYFPTMQQLTNGTDILQEVIHNSFDAILIDDSLPFSEALNTVEKIKMVKKSLLTIIVATHPTCEELLQAVRISINAVLTLPLQTHEIEEMSKKLYFISLSNQQTIKQNLLLNQYKNALDSCLNISKTNINGVITYVNEHFCYLYGYKAEEIIGQRHVLFHHPENTAKEQMIDLWKKAQSKHVWHGTLINKAKSEDDIYTDTYIIPLLNGKYEIEEYMDMRIDVTALETHLRTLQTKIYEATQEIKGQQESLIAQSRSAALGEMFDNIAHQWRQPIGAINNAIINAEFALELAGMTTDEILETFKQINTYTAFLSGTIDDFRNFSNPDKDKTIFPLHQCIGQTINIIRGAYEMNNISLEYTPDNALRTITVYGPQGELSQVLLNILSNARDAIKENGYDSGNVRIDLSATDDSITLSITDNAGGIPETVLPKIFDPYFTTKNKVQGSGIGLYMSKTIIEKHFEGKIEAANEEKGAIFTITLPIHNYKE
ncbi:MAG: ATP-binding protein [Sulfuricurvum sp.]|uniref:ATP-binding protein n=1 Tax=Sulfuricurvum sp. TaxID=2025608 RepID=UPI00262A95D8|nr:ATP-binding protein [Sulfuricurvum sp.]MDD2829540.1 ATP-binding protein [Sulfuricurvum sp.]MDD4950472.1 ATP-binding protein [Sulfuricurvum sp.]